MKSFAVFLVLLLSFSCKAQPPLLTTSKKAESAYRDGEKMLGQRQFEKGISAMEKAKKADPNFVEPYIVLGDLYQQLGKPEKAVEEFKGAFAINPTFHINSLVNCADIERQLGRYEDALAHYEDFYKFRKGNGSPTAAQRAEKGKKSCLFAIEAMKHPVPFNPVNMGPGVNSATCEYFAGVTADDATFLYTRNHQVVGAKREQHQDIQEDFYMSLRQPDGSWGKSVNIGPPINTPNNEGAPSLSPDGRYLFFAACADMAGDYGNGRNGLGRCDIFFSEKKGDTWSTPSNVGPPVNSAAWESQPSFASDGRTLYFSSNREGGFGDGDLWMSQLDDNGRWSRAVNLGEKINTSGREEAIFIHPDNQTIYFASNGHGGMGGLDLFISRRDTSGNWGEPENLGYPINTYKDESGLIVNGVGDMAYFSSNREGSLGCEDFYMFEFPKNLRPNPVTYMKGKVFDSKTKKPLQAGFVLIDLETGKNVITSNSDPVNGSFLLCVPANKNYALNVSREGYVFYTESFLLKESPDRFKPVQKDVPLDPIENGVEIALNNIYFETGKYDLKPESKAELQKLVDFLNKNPKIKGEIGGHTDNVGKPADNLLLSNNRAKAVYDYLVKNGIAAARLTSKGYGDTVPVADNSTPEGRQKNRRTVFKVTTVK